MSTAIITANIDETDSKNFAAFCEDMGLSVSAAVNFFVKTVLREKRIPFSIEQTPDPFYSPENQAYVLKSVCELREGKGSVHQLIDDKQKPLPQLSQEGQFLLSPAAQCTNPLPKPFHAFRLGCLSCTTHSPAHPCPSPAQ